VKKYNMVYREYAIRENSFEVTAESEEDARRQAHDTFIVKVAKGGE